MKKDELHERFLKRLDEQVTRVDTFVEACIARGPNKKYALQALREFQRYAREALCDDQRAREHRRNLNG